MYASQAGNFSLALVGDVIPTRRLAVFDEPRYLAVRDILCEADATFGNFDSTVHWYLDGFQAQGSRGASTYMTTEPPLLEDLKWLGIDIMAIEGSHATDYGAEGVLRSLEYWRESGIAHAGLGRHLAEARSPAFLDTNRGRVALIAATAPPNKPLARAGEQRPDTAGMPGINGIRTKQSYVVDRDTLDELRALGEKVGVEAEKARKVDQGVSIPQDTDDVYHFFGTRFEVGDEPQVRSTANDADIAANLRSVRSARFYADKVVVSLHAHHQDGPALMTARKRSDIEQSSDVLRSFAHQSIDEGADVFVGHGNSVPLGIEIYKGCPIFHSIGSFVFQLDTVDFLPHEAYDRFGLDWSATAADFTRVRYSNDTRGHMADRLMWEQFFAVCDYEDGHLDSIRLYPLDLGFGSPRSQRGRPLLAEGEIAERVIDRVQRLSAPLGTHVEFEDGIGVIRLKESQKGGAS